MHVFADIRTPDGPPELDLVGGPLGRYDLVYADPPWSFDNYSEKGEDRNAKSWYDCMDIEDIWALPVGDLAAENCMLAMWATFPLLPEAIETCRRWGFRYVTIGHVWIKLNKNAGIRKLIDTVKDVFMSTGYWTRSNAEIIILASKGSPTRGARNIRQVVHAPRGLHSEKPLIFRSNLEKLIVAPKGQKIRRIELFCRREAIDDWHAWGNQVGALEAGTIKKRKIATGSEPIVLDPGPLFAPAAIPAPLDPITALAA
jgi:N6-adenosine-specific RNA methylase IME4